MSCNKISVYNCLLLLFFGGKGLLIFLYKQFIDWSMDLWIWKSFDFISLQQRNTGKTKYEDDIVLF